MKRLSVLILTVFLVTGCEKKAEEVPYVVDPTSEMAQQIGDTMASIDESGGQTNGGFASINLSGDEKMFARMSLSESLASKNISSLFLPEAQAANCNTMAFSGCSSGRQVKTFSNCTVGTTGRISGTVALQYSVGSSCTIPLNTNHSVTRVPDFTITGLRGATYTVSATSSGQTLTRVSAGAFSFSNSGIRRKFTNSEGTTLLDVTATTNGPIIVSGSARAGRGISANPGVGIVVTDNLTSVSCTLIPTALTWTADCNCPTSGSWSGTCSDASNVSMAFNSVCGDAVVVRDSEVKAVTLDRCQP
jgi:hypothetical protein